jgi:hypothetical protein
MTISGTDVVEQLRGRMKFYPDLRRDLEWACEEINDLRIRRELMQAMIVEAEKRLDSVANVDGVTGDGLSRVTSLSVFNAASVGAWLDEEGIKLMPWQRKRLGLDPVEKEQDLTPHPRLDTPVE